MSTTKNGKTTCTCCECKVPIKLPKDWKDPRVVPPHKDKNGNDCPAAGLLSMEELKPKTQSNQ